MDRRLQQPIEKAAAALPQQLQSPVRQWFERLAEQHDPDRLPADQAEALVRLVACSEFGAAVVLRHWDWFVANVATFGDRTALSQPELTVDTNDELDTARSKLRQCRNRTMLRILWRELDGLAALEETLGELSGLADEMLDTAKQVAERTLAPRYGQVRGDSGEVVPFVILAMGKLGGRELNFSSDIDLIFLYAEDGTSDGAKRISAQEYFGRLSRLIVSIIDEVTTDGFVFRIDTRLRPFGESGPPVVSFAALESYLLQHGRDWERYAYVKARVVGTDPGPDVSNMLNAELIRPFVYRRYLDYGVFASLREMHGMIAAEVERRELTDNVKLGPGGIREAEFIVQSLQLVRGGSETALQDTQLLPVLTRLVGPRGMSGKRARRLEAAYRYLRRIENFIQAIRDQQTHDLPGGDADRARLCVAMCYRDWNALLADLDAHRKAVSSEFGRVAFREQTPDTPFRQRLAEAWESNADEARWQELLRHGNENDAGSLAELLVAFRNASPTQQIGSIAADRLRKFMPDLITRALQADEPLASLTRALSVVERVLRRSAYLALLNENPGAMTRLVDLCGSSQFITDQIALYPVLLDELLDPRVHSANVTRDDLALELGKRLSGMTSADSEALMDVIVQYQRATMFRIAVADFSGTLPIMKVSDGLTWLAESVLDEALRVVWRDMTARHGVPCYKLDGTVYEAGFGIVGYGKLGGLELSYGSDLDIVFLHDSQGEAQQTNGKTPIDNTRFFARLVRRLVLFLTTQTGSGELYEIDTRLRPDGRSGLLVTSTDAFERYQDDNAWTWEHQALLRARAVAGSTSVAAQFERIRRDTLINRVNRDALRDDVVSMRRRMRKELDRSSKQQFDLKHGAGGIGDIEFLVQYLVLNNAKVHPDVIHYSDNIRQLDALAEAGCMENAVANRLQDCYRGYRLRLHRLVLEKQAPLADSTEFDEERRFVIASWNAWLI